jgi:dTMP kinase
VPIPTRLIAIEGGEGAGKSTQAVRLAGAIGADLTREPGGSSIGEQIRILLLDPSLGHLVPRAELHLMLAARAQHVAERISPALGAGRSVVVDRFSGSTLAYQGYGRGLPIDEVAQACGLATGGLWPDLSVLLDLPLELALARRADRHATLPGAEPDRIESEQIDFHARVNGGFRRLADDDPEHWVVVDGSRSEDEVAVEVLAVVRARLGTGSTR